jgi:hypothetical protein
MIAMVNAFCAPWLDATRLRMTNRVILWTFALDRQVDELATSRSEIDDLTRRCLAVADGGAPEPGDPLTRLLAALRTELVATPAAVSLFPVWREELRLSLDAMATEWSWLALRADADGVLPTVDEYLDNSHNLCFSLVFTTFWLTTSGPPPHPHIDEILAASRHVQQVMRLLNDLATYRRDLATNDLNLLMLGVTATAVTELREHLDRRGRELLGPLRLSHPELGAFLQRYPEYNQGFWGVTDYWQPQ